MNFNVIITNYEVMRNSVTGTKCPRTRMSPTTTTLRLRLVLGLRLGCMVRAGISH